MAKNTAAVAATESGLKFKVKENLTLPLLSPKLNEPIYIRFERHMEVGKQIKDKDAALVAHVTNLETGELMQYLVPAVFQGILHDDYGAPLYGAPTKGEPVQQLEPAPEGQEHDRYVGRCFKVIKHEKKAGKLYHTLTIMEIEVEND